MLTVRHAAERGHTQLDWLDSRHTFSFDRYHDPRHMAFGPLRVINEDRIAPGGGFATHPHRDMEIITCVIDGQLQHEDSLGNGSVISPGEIQKMSAGSGILHSEFNASQEKPVHLLQIWIIPDQLGIELSYEQQRFELQPGVWKLLGSHDGEALVSIKQQVRLFGLLAEPGTSVSFSPQQRSRLWIQIVAGGGSVAGVELRAGDGLAARCDGPIEIRPSKPTELLLFEFLTEDG